jgi:hypothetical protein
MKLKIKKASIEVIVEGCVECGTKWSSDWSLAKVVEVRIGDRTGQINLYLCEDCNVTGHKSQDRSQLNLFTD